MDSAQLRKDRGAFFTPEAISEFMVAWAVRSPHDRVLEPSCGEASFLLAAGHHLRNLGASLHASDQLVGVELHAQSADNARRLMASESFASTVIDGDYFTSEVDGQFDAVVGNPPFIRYQDFTGAARTRSREAALSLGVNLTGLSSSWAAFVVHACTQLTASGRLALVLPAELLTVNYAATIRSFLLDRFASVRLVSFDRLVFPGAQEDVVLLLAEGRGSTDHLELYQAHDAEDLERVATEQWRTVPADREGRWIGGLLSDQIKTIYDNATEQAGFCELRDWGRTYLGSVTGNNKWFALTDAEVGTLRLPATDLTRISPPGSAHLRGLTLTDAAWNALRKDGKRVWLFRPPGEPSTPAADRIKAGKKAKVDDAYKCRVRSPWWRVPLVETPDLFLTYMNHAAPQLVANRAGLRHINSIHGVKLLDDHRQLGMDLLPMAMLNSVTLLGAELVGRSYGGGMLKLEPREADRLPMPSLEHLTERSAELRAMRPQLTRFLRSGNIVAAAAAVDRVLLTGTRGVRSQDRKLLVAAREALFERRRTRSKATS